MVWVHAWLRVCRACVCMELPASSAGSRVNVQAPTHVQTFTSRAVLAGEGITPTQSAVAGEPWLLLSRIDPSVSRSTSQSQLPQRRRTTNWWADASLRLHPNSSSKRESGEGGCEHYQVRRMARCHCEIK